MPQFDALKSPLLAYAVHNARFVPPFRWVTFSPPSSTLTNFPVLVKARNYTNIANGYDVHFQDANGNELAFELDWYDNSTKSGAWWVQIPTLSSSVPTSIMMHYGDAELTWDQSSPETLWEDYKYVYHFADLENLFSSIGTQTASLTAGTRQWNVAEMTSDSFTGRGLRLEANDGYSSDRARLDLGAMGISGTGGVTMIASNGTMYNTTQRDVSWDSGWGHFSYLMRSKVSTFSFKGQTKETSDLSLICYGAECSSSSGAFVVNGVDQNTSKTGTYRWDGRIQIGATGQSSSRPTGLTLDEFRFSNVFHGASWLLYEQNQIINHDIYTTYGPEEK